MTKVLGSNPLQTPPTIRETFVFPKTSFVPMKKINSFDVTIHTCIPNTLEIEAGGSLQIVGQSLLHNTQDQH